MESEAPLDKKTGFVELPQHQCFKDSSGVCRLRRLPSSNFDCVFAPEVCSHFKVKEKESKSVQ